MKKILSMAIAAFAAVLFAAGALAAQSLDDPRIGSWDEQKTSTDFDPLLRVFVDAGGGKIRMIVNARLLEANRWHVDFKCDGAVYRVFTQDRRFAGVTYSCRRTGARSFTFSTQRLPPDPGVTVAVGAAGEWLSTTGTETVSSDGRTYDTTAVLTFTDGHRKQSNKQFVRRGP